VVLDNLNTHKPEDDRWLKAHPNVHFHFTSTQSCWLNQIECWFSILSRSALQGASFTSVEMLIKAIETFIAKWNQNAAPLEWCAAPRYFVGTGQVQRRIISWELACGVRRNLTRGQL
jgi:DDE superfamily endonuclease